MEAQYLLLLFLMFPLVSVRVVFPINHHGSSKSMGFISDLIGVVALKRAGWFRIMCDESVLRPWQLSRTFWGGGQPGCWGGLHPGQW